MGVSLKKIKENLVDAYLSQIKSTYVSSDSDKRRQIEGTLEVLVNKLEKGEPIETLRSGKLNKSPFDGAIARKIRTDLKLSFSELCTRIGFADLNNINSYKSFISRFENNRASIQPRSAEVLKYLNWLKEQGYNPYNL